MRLAGIARRDVQRGRRASLLFQRRSFRSDGSGKGEVIPNRRGNQRGDFSARQYRRSIVAQADDANVTVANLNTLQFTSKLSAVELWKYYRLGDA